MMIVQNLNINYIKNTLLNDIFINLYDIKIDEDISLQELNLYYTMS